MDACGEVHCASVSSFQSARASSIRNRYENLFRAKRIHRIDAHRSHHRWQRRHRSCCENSQCWQRQHADIGRFDLVEQRFDISLMATTVSPIIIMMPGLYAFETIVLFNHGEMSKALQAGASCGFVIGALAMGLATSRFFQQRMT